MTKDDIRPEAASHNVLENTKAHMNSGADASTQHEQGKSEKSPKPIAGSSFFSLPQPIKQVFDKFPLKTYGPNELPERASHKHGRDVLYVFATADGAKKGRPSFNPACLKWQTYLRFCGIRHGLLPSNNHSSPSGALPYLLPASSSSPVASSKIPKWVSQKGGRPLASPAEAEAYTSLLDHRIRAAWLHTLYLVPRNFDAVVQRLYISPSTSSVIVQTALAHQIQSAAQAELLKLSPSSTPSLDQDGIYTEARLAFEALSTALGDDDWFFAGDEPQLFDASIFAYTYLILDKDGVLGWRDTRLREQLRRFDNLARHAERIMARYYSS